MKTCINCGANVTAIDSRGAGIVKGITCLVRRRHECPVCKTRYTTYEITETELSRLSSAVEVVYKTIPNLTKRIGELSGSGVFIEPRGSRETNPFTPQDAHPSVQRGGPTPVASDAADGAPEP